MARVFHRFTRATAVSVPHMPVGFNYPGGVALPQVAINRNGYGHVGELVAGQALHSQGLDGAGGITKSHIESLKHNLKRVEDQLQYNVHQIDVKHMEGLAREIRHSIKALDEALPRQLEFEEMHYPKSDKNDSRQGGAAFNPMTLQATAGLNGCHVALKSNGTLEQGAGSLSRGNRGLFSIEHAFPRHTSSDSEQFRQFSGLPMTAATAAPFSPSVQSFGFQVGSSSEDGCREPESKDNSRKSLLSVSGKAVREAATGIAKNDHGRAVRSKAGVLQSNLTGQSGSSIELTDRQSPRSTPYLVGSLAPGTLTASFPNTEGTQPLL
ncbi:unnamed protein product [Parascedosporium putredinis]|uniref:Uncharacterized protein n=1 Tax=Parascedosporium putredinis TaxID=1442378 RepID=A0A9P1GX88_9PEZI|nr:unnamed protein product [Parascedosporium putredinis]CAI7988800.1 unnamed protein product [Parascedosporium putredinis]